MTGGVDLLMGLGGTESSGRVKSCPIGQQGLANSNRREDYSLLVTLTEKRDSDTQAKGSTGPTAGATRPAYVRV
jgi:hypothetical protein